MQESIKYFRWCSAEVMQIKNLENSLIGKWLHTKYCNTVNRWSGPDDLVIQTLWELFFKAVLQYKKKRVYIDLK